MFTTTLSGHYIPLTWLTLGLDYVIWGMEPAGYHFHEPRAACGERDPRVPVGETPPDFGTAGRRRVRVARRRRRGGAVLRGPPLRPSRCLGDATSRRPVGPVVPDFGVDLSSGDGCAAPLAATDYFCSRASPRSRWRCSAKSIVMTLPLLLLVLDWYRYAGCRVCHGQRATGHVLLEKNPVLCSCPRGRRRSRTGGSHATD